MRILALDFDGVIADSEIECLAVGFNAYKKFFPKTKLFSGKEFTCANFDAIIWKNRKLISKYKKLRPFVIDAFCWLVMLQILENKFKAVTQKEFGKVRDSLIEYHDEYVKEFYRIMSKFQEEDFDGWLRFIKPYSIVKNLPQLAEKFTIAIATNNRAETIKRFLDRHNVPYKTIADSSLGINKSKQIDFIKKKFSVNFKDIIFVDDQISHLKTVSRLGANCLLASWGYTTSDQKKQAKKLGIRIIAPEEFINMS